MDSEETASGAQGSGPPRRSPRFVAQGQQKLKVYKSNKDRKKRLKLPSPSPADVQSEAHGGDEDPDFHPDIEAEGGGDADVGADDGGLNVASKKRLRKQPPAIRCSPAKFLELLGAAPVDVIDQVKAKGFGGLLGFKPICLDRKLLTWIMPRLNPESMKLEIGGGKEIPVTEHAIWCIFQIPKFGGDPPSMSDVDARTKRNELGEQICPSSYKRFGIRISDIVDGLKTNRLTGDLAVRAFFMGVFQCLLFSNTDSHIRLEDVIYTENLDDIGNINWCKVVVDNICRAARLYRKDFPAKGAQTPINGCGIFLIMLYVDHLLHGLDVDPFTLTRCAILESKTIDAISALDRRGDVPADVVEYGNLRVWCTSKHGL